MLTRSAQHSRKSKQGVSLTCLSTLNHLPKPGNDGFAELIMCKWRILRQDADDSVPCSFIDSVR